MRYGSKRSCSHTSSRVEAEFHFRQRELARLDSDRDGVPCERPCR
jgi:hypothetical protein